MKRFLLGLLVGGVVVAGAFVTVARSSEQTSPVSPIELGQVSEPQKLSARLKQAKAAERDRRQGSTPARSAPTRSVPTPTAGKSDDDDQPATQSPQPSPRATPRPPAVQPPPSPPARSTEPRAGAASVQLPPAPAGDDQASDDQARDDDGSADDASGDGDDAGGDD